MSKLLKHKDKRESAEKGRSLSLDDIYDDIISPEDPKAEVIRLRKVLKGKEEEIRNLGAQVKSFEDIAGGNVEEIAQLKDQLEAAQAEIKKLSDRSELVQVYNSLRAEVAVAREDLKKSESEKQDLEVERDVWESEISAERDNNQNFQSEIARLKAALHFYEINYPQADTENILDDSEQNDRELVERMKTENANLQAKIRQKEAVVTSLTKSRSTVETRFLRLQEERDKMAEQIVALTAVRANLKGELSRCDEVKRNTDKFASQLQQDVLTKIKEKEMMIQEIQTLQNDLEARKQEVKDLRDELEARKQEVAIVREDFKLELEQSKAGKWRAQERKYQEDLRNQDLRLKHLTHESEQRVMKLTIKLEEKTAECDRVLQNAQREADEQCDQLRQERNSIKRERDRYKEEREMLSAEFNRTATMYDEKKLQLQEKQEEYDSLQENLEVLKREKQEQYDSLHEILDVSNAKNSSLEDRVQQLERETMEFYELTASKNCQLENRLQEVNGLLTKERRGFSEELDHQRQLREADRCRLEGDTARLSEEVLQLRQQIRQAETTQCDLRGDKLDPYVLTDIEPYQGSNFKESGAYGSVSLVQVNGGVICIQKRLHDILLGYGRNEDVGEEQRQSISEGFRKECVFLSQMRHPNIVQFVGVCGRDSSLSLIMEHLPMSIDRCLKRCNSNDFSIPLCYKLSILRDVVYGLLYLHMNSMIHRDLSAGNVLLTSDLRAKIADFGVSRYLTPTERMKLTKAPGARYIMPPEALKENCQYNEKMDVFSFGVLSLELMLQQCPDLSPEGITPQRAADKETEIGRRIQSIEKISNGSIKSVICACLQDLPKSRLSTPKLKNTFECLCREHPNEHGDTIQMLRTINRLEQEKEANQCKNCKP